MIQLLFCDYVKITFESQINALDSIQLTRKCIIALDNYFCSILYG